MRAPFYIGCLSSSPDFFVHLRLQRNYNLLRKKKKKKGNKELRMHGLEGMMSEMEGVY